MAQGDSFAVFMGTAETDRQPASGVFEEVSSITKSGTTDLVAQFDGTDVSPLLDAAIRTPGDIVDSATAAMQMYNMALKIGNSIRLRKAGTTDRIGVSGVQVDA